MHPPPQVLQNIPNPEKVDQFWKSRSNIGFWKIFRLRRLCVAAAWYWQLRGRKGVKTTQLFEIYRSRIILAKSELYEESYGHLKSTTNVGRKWFGQCLQFGITAVYCIASGFCISNFLAINVQTLPRVQLTWREAFLVEVSMLKAITKPGYLNGLGKVAKKRPGWHRPCKFWNPSCTFLKSNAWWV